MHAAKAAARAPRLLEIAVTAAQGGACGWAIARWREQMATLAAYDAMQPELAKVKRSSLTLKKSLKETEASKEDHEERVKVRRNWRNRRNGLKRRRATRSREVRCR